MRGWLLGAAAALAILALLFGRAAQERGWGKYLRLIKEGTSSLGIVTRAEGDGTCRADYRYTVTGVSYSGSAPVCGVRVGQQVRVTYLAEEPSLSCLGSPADRLAQEMISSLFGRLFFPEHP